MKSLKNSNNEIKATPCRFMRKGIKGIYDKILKIIYKILGKDIIWINSYLVECDKPNKNGRIYSSKIIQDLFKK